MGRHPAGRITPLPDPLPRPLVAKKADLEASFRTCQTRCAEATRAEADGDYSRALERAVAALPLLREYIAYLRRYQKVEAPHLPPVDLILQYAPPLFARGVLDTLDAWLAEAGRAERAAYPDLPGRLEAARRRLALAIRVWPAWPVTAPSPDGSDATELLRFWTRYGAVARRPGTDAPIFEPVTHPRRSALGKCPGCRRTHETVWAALLDPSPCPHCRAAGPFVIVARTT